MEKTNLINKIEEHISISDKEETIINEYFKVKNYHAFEHVQWFGGETAHFVYVNKGSVRLYHIVEGREITTNVVTEDSFISPVLSFITGEASREYLQCMEETELFTLTKTRMNDLYDIVRNWDKLGRLYMEYNYCLMAERILPKVKDEKERFLAYFETADRSIFERIPVEILSSFLEIHEDRLQRFIDKYDK